MVRLASQRVLLVSDEDQRMRQVLAQAAPNAHIQIVDSVFDAIAELTREHYTTILLAAEPIERRPESAVRTLREISGETRLLLFGHPTLEPISRKMLSFGVDDYLITPATSDDLQSVLEAPRQPAPALPVHDSYLSDELPSDVADDELNETFGRAALAEVSLDAIPVADICLEVMVKYPAEALRSALARINQELPSGASLRTEDKTTGPIDRDAGQTFLTREIDQPGGRLKALHLSIDATISPASAAAFLDATAPLLSKLDVLQERHIGLQRLAITDDLTGVSNGRYFRHFLTKIVERAREMCFPVTLFLFDIDRFKRYNDEFGHGVGDDILKQTASLMRRCVRDHDLVARISGDEFAVVFWEKEGPRQPRETRTNAAAGARTPREPRQILDRFRKLLATADFPGLGANGKGTLTISGGLAVFPYHAQDVAGLYKAADHCLMFGAKRAGRNQIQLVGDNDARESQIEDSDSATE